MAHEAARVQERGRRRGTYLDYLKADTGNVTDGVALTTKPGNQNLILTK